MKYAVSKSALNWGNVDCVVLDMDGTLLDLHFDNQVWKDLLPRRVAERSGAQLADVGPQVEATLNATRGTLDFYCLDHWSREFGMSMSALERELTHLVRVREGASHFLNALVNANIRLLLATNAHRDSLSHKLERTGIEVHFDDIYSAHDFGYCKEEDAFWDALRNAHEFDPARTLFVDDNHAVLDAAARFGVAYLFGIKRPSSRGADLSHDRYHCLESFDEIMPHAPV